ncbi:hypothetical protein [Bacillus methanolicus]|uniref:hypothetical protein n=1 Tax=Bacillus methanolicus TaxID=1471 RepID=UPI0023802E3B|nr:hypothetical protein [Bacillus methanolicus]
MIIEFFAKDNHFIVTPDKIYRNGEMIAEGKVQIHHLMFNDPAWIEIEKGEDLPRTFLKTDNVTAVLPNQEFYNGERCIRKDFKVSFLAFIQNQWIKREKVIPAVNEFHVRQILNHEHGKNVRFISAISSVNSN